MKFASTFGRSYFVFLLVLSVLIFIRCSDIGNSGANAIVSISAVTESVTEGEYLTFKVDITKAIYDDLIISYTVQGYGNTPVSVNDFADNAIAGSYMLAAGQLSGEFSVKTADDLFAEPSEYLTVTISTENGEVIVSVQNFAVASINNASDSITKPGVSISAVDGDVTEGEDLTYKITLSEATSTDINVGYSSAGSGSQEANAADFNSLTMPAGTVTIEEGDTEASLTITSFNDEIPEVSEEFTITLDSAGDYATLNPGSISATGTINNDDSNESVPEVTISTRAASINEGESVTLDIQLNVAVGNDIDVDYSTAGSSVDPADADDFNPSGLPAGTVTITAGETGAELVITTNDDGDVENNEEFTVTIDAVDNPAIIGAFDSAVVGINNDD